MGGTVYDGCVILRRKEVNRIKRFLFTALAATALSLALTSCADGVEIGEPQEELPSDPLAWTAIKIPLTKEQRADVSAGKMVHLQFKENSAVPAFKLKLLDQYWSDDTNGMPFYIDEDCKKKVTLDSGYWDGTYEDKSVFEDADEVDVYFVPTKAFLKLITETKKSNWEEEDDNSDKALRLCFVGNGSYGGATLLPLIETMTAPEIQEEEEEEEPVYPIAYTDWRTGVTSTKEGLDFDFSVAGNYKISGASGTVTKDGCAYFVSHAWWETGSIAYYPVARDLSSKTKMTITMKIADLEDGTAAALPSEQGTWQLPDISLITDADRKSTFTLSSDVAVSDYSDYEKLEINFADFLGTVNLYMVNEIKFDFHAAVGQFYIKSITFE